MTKPPTRSGLTRLLLCAAMGVFGVSLGTGCEEQGFELPEQPEQPQQPQQPPQPQQTPQPSDALDADQNGGNESAPAMPLNPQ